MWPILMFSVVSIAIILERAYFFSKCRTKIPNLLARVRVLLKQDKIKEALTLCESVAGPISYILAIGIHIRKRSPEERERIIEQAASKEVRKLENNLNFLAIIGNISPLLGLLGTVTGMIKTFKSVQELSGRVDVAILAGGIWEALITTAAGLTVAIPTIIFYHYFEGKVDSIIKDMVEAVAELLEGENFAAGNAEGK